MQISDNEIYLLIKYIKSVLWRVVKRLSYIQDARALNVKEVSSLFLPKYFSFNLKNIYISNFTVASTEMYQRIPWELFEAPL